MQPCMCPAQDNKKITRRKRAWVTAVHEQFRHMEPRRKTIKDTHTRSNSKLAVSRICAEYCRIGLRRLAYREDDERSRYGRVSMPRMRTGIVADNEDEAYRCRR